MRLAAPLLAIALTAGTLAPAVAAGIDLPARKAGQWEIRMAIAAGRPPMTIQMCLDAATDRAMMAAGLSASKGTCTNQKMTRSGNTIVSDSTCKIGRMTVVSHAVVTGDFQSAYTVKVESKTTGGVSAINGSHVITQDVRWVSPTCGNGLKPGEMLMPGGMKVDVVKMLKSPGG